MKAKGLLSALLLAAGLASTSCAQRESTQGILHDSRQPMSQPRLTQQKSAQSAPQRFCVESFDAKALRRLVEIENVPVCAQGWKETTWNGIEPQAPENGKHAYVPPSRGWLESMAVLNAAGRRPVIITLEFYSRWALQLSDSIKVSNPRTGKKVPGIERIKPEHRQDWQDLVTHVLAGNPLVTHLQIDNEPDNIWVDGRGYAEALRLAYEAVQEFNAANPGRNVKIMAAGFYLPPVVFKLPKEEIEFLQRNYPNIDVARIAQRHPGFSEPQIRHAAQKLNVVLSTLLQDRPSFDILTVHLDEGRTYDRAGEALDWYRSAMARKGYERPIWIDDMSTTYFPPEKGASPQDHQLTKGLLAENPKAVAIYTRMQPIWLVRKSVGWFAAGAERVSLAYGVNPPDPIVYWRYTGLIAPDNTPKAAFYTAKLLVRKLQGFQKVTRMGEYVYRFSFADRPDVYVAWSEKGSQEFDLSGSIPAAQVRVTHLVTETAKRGDPVVKADLTVPSKAIPLTDEPVFIQAAN